MIGLSRKGYMVSVPQDCELSVYSLITSAFWAATLGFRILLWARKRTSYREQLSFLCVEWFKRAFFSSLLPLLFWSPHRAVNGFDPAPPPPGLGSSRPSSAPGMLPLSVWVPSLQVGSLPSSSSPGHLRLAPRYLGPALCPCLPLHRWQRAGCMQWRLLGSAQPQDSARYQYWLFSLLAVVPLVSHDCTFVGHKWYIRVLLDHWMWKYPFITSAS